MATITRRKATGYSRWLTEWKYGTPAGRAEPAGKGEYMAHDLLATFFARYPSALGSTHAGGQYRIICPECGHIVPVAVLDEETTGIHVHCAHCGYDDDLREEPKEGVADAA
jgi:Zn ribbon nucleic-acid-binding protein